MIKNKLLSALLAVGLATSFSASAVTNQNAERYDDYDVKSVLSAKDRGDITVNEDIAINSPDDYNIKEVYKAKTTAGIKLSNIDRSDLDNVNDY